MDDLPEHFWLRITSTVVLAVLVLDLGRRVLF
jgi:hypothetical protein